MINSQAKQATQGLPYRRNAGIVLFNLNGDVLVGERARFLGNFQFPQGGLKKGEAPLTGAIREFWEETGWDISKEKLVLEIPGWVRYDFPPDLVPPGLEKYRGQEQKWYFFYWADKAPGEIDDRVQKLDNTDENAEFTQIAWMDFLEICENIIFFKKNVYEELFRLGVPCIRKFLSKLNAVPK